MAEAILSGLARKIIESLGSLLIQEIGATWGLKKELSKLRASLSTINAILLDAEKEGATNEVVKNWLRKLKDVAYDAEDVLDAVATEALRQKVELPNNIVLKEVCRSFSCSNPLVFRLKMAHKIKDIIERLEHIQKDGNIVAQSQLIIHQSVDMNINDDRRHTDPIVIESEVLGREKDKEKLVELLTSGGGNNEENVMVIPIIGIGGLGKTTLAQLVYNDESVIKKHFELRMWVCVSFDFDIVHLAKKILESVTNDNCGGLGEIDAKSKLMKKLSGKRYLLVLDDVWNEKNPGKWEDLRKLLIGGASGSVILVTTRSEVVASIMEPIKYKHKLEGLNANDCQSLFNQRAFGRKGEEANHPELVEIGKGIVKKCGGVPLAAKALGSLLRLKRNKKDWLNILDTEIWNLEEQEILPALRISYNHLPSHLKQCFAYCTMFPEDHEIEVDDLIHQWMAHGFILQPPPPTRGGGSHSTMSLEDIGYGYFRDLLWRSFFQEVTEDDKLGKIVYCKMHDLVHSLARWVAGVEWLEVTKEYSPSGIISKPEGVRHMVVSYEVGAQATGHKAQKLRTLYMQGKPYELKFHNEFFSHLRGLRVLKLMNMKITHVPISIGYLEQLRYLDLSYNVFEALPNSICRLYNLQTLRLEGCWYFKEWPRDITKMVSLRHLQLDTRGRFMKYMPRGLGQLSSLQTLLHFIVGDERRRRGGGLGELHGLNQLRGELFIRELGNVKYARDAKEANLKDKSELQSLILDWGFPGDNRRRRSSVEEQVLENLQPHQNLKALSIEYYEGIKMPRWMLHSSYSLLLPNLVELKINECHNLKCLPLVGEFPCLRRLHLLNLEALESISNKVVMTERGNNNNNNNEGRGRGGQEGKPLLMVLFPMLQQLELSSMPNLERWTISVGQEEEEAQQNNHLHFLPSMFPRLIDLKLQYCKKLTTVPMLSVEGMQQLTSLRILKLECLDKLVSLPDFPAPATLEFLHIINCPRLVRLPDSFFDNLKLLSEFEISYCNELTSLPQGIQHLIALKRLKIRQCSNLLSLPQGIQKLTALIDLDISRCPRLKILPEGLGSLSSLQRLEIENCSNLSSIPEGIRHLTSLKTLKLCTCPGLKALPYGLGSLSSLQELKIQDCSNLSSLPEGNWNLTSLKTLNIWKCPILNTLSGGLGSLSSLQVLQIHDCSNLSSLPEGNWNLTSLKTLNIWKCPILNTLSDGLGSLSSLQELKIQDCSNLSSLPEGNWNLTSLKTLNIWKCPILNTLSGGLGSLSSLQVLQIHDCSNLSSLPEGIRQLIALKELRISECPGLKTLPEGMGNLSSLQELEIHDCSNLLSLPEGIQHLPALLRLSIDDCPCLRSLPGGLENLAWGRILQISDCPNLSLSWGWRCREILRNLS